MSSDSLVDLMEQCKDQYLNTNGKNTFFKKSQKIDCAKEICQTFSLQDMIQKTVYNIPNTNKVIFDYNVYKLYAHTDNFETIVNSVISIYDDVLKNYTNLEVHVLLNSFSVSAAERYKGAIMLFSIKSTNSSIAYSDLIEKIYIYHTPSMMESISTLLKPFIDKRITNKVVYYSKADSDELIKKLFV